MKKKDALIETGIYEYIMNVKSEKIRKMILSESKVTEYKKGDIFYSNSENQDLTFVFLSGKLNFRVYVSDEVEYTLPWDNRFWYGIFRTLSSKDILEEYEMNFLEDTTVLSFPLKKIMHSEPKENIDLWMRISKMASDKHIELQSKIIERSALSTEAFFLKSLVNSGYSYENMSIQEIGYGLNINTRTLQRLIQNLEKQNLIKREKISKRIYVKDQNQVDNYLNSIM